MALGSAGSALRAALARAGAGGTDRELAAGASTLAAATGLPIGADVSAAGGAAPRGAAALAVGTAPGAAGPRCASRPIAIPAAAVKPSASAVLKLRRDCRPR